MVFVLVLASFFMTAFDIREHILFIHDICSQSELKARKPVHYKHDFGMQGFHDQHNPCCVCARVYVSANLFSVIYQQFHLP